MLVVADSSPIIALVSIDHVQVLPAMFDRIVVPPEVVAELRSDRRPSSVRDLVVALPDWFIEQAPQVVESVPKLHPGELAAISLAHELQADLLLIDEAAGRKVAKAKGLAVVGTIGVLELAAERNLLDLKEAFDRLKRTDFWISPRLLDTRLRRFENRRGS